MTFGIFKKLKDGFHKVRKFINYNIPRVIDFVKKAKPALEKIDLNKLQPIIEPSKLDKLKQFRNKAVELSDDVINIDDKLKNDDYEGAITYAGRKFIPRLKRK